MLSRLSLHRAVNTRGMTKRGMAEVDACSTFEKSGAIITTTAAPPDLLGTYAGVLPPPPPSDAFEVSFLARKSDEVESGNPSLPAQEAHYLEAKADGVLCKPEKREGSQYVLGCKLDPIFETRSLCGPLVHRDGENYLALPSSAVAAAPGVLQTSPPPSAPASPPPPAGLLTPSPPAELLSPPPLQAAPASCLSPSGSVSPVAFPRCLERAAAEVEAARVLSEDLSNLPGTPAAVPATCVSFMSPEPTQRLTSPPPVKRKTKRSVYLPKRQRTMERLFESAAMLDVAYEEKAGGSSELNANLSVEELLVLLDTPDDELCVATLTGDVASAFAEADPDRKHSPVPSDTDMEVLGLRLQSTSPPLEDGESSSDDELNALSMTLFERQKPNPLRRLSFLWDCRPVERETSC